MLPPSLEHDYTANRSGGLLRERRGKLEARRKCADTGAGRAEDIFFTRIFTTEQHRSDKDNFKESSAQEETRIRMRHHIGTYVEHHVLRFCESIVQRDG